MFDTHFQKVTLIYSAGPYYTTIKSKSTSGHQNQYVFTDPCRNSGLEACGIVGFSAEQNSKQCHMSYLLNC